MIVNINRWKNWNSFPAYAHPLLYLVTRRIIVDIKTSNILFWCNHSTVCLKYEGHLFTALFKYVNGTTCYFHKMWWKFETSENKVWSCSPPSCRGYISCKPSELVKQEVLNLYTLIWTNKSVIYVKFRVQEKNIRLKLLHEISCKCQTEWRSRHSDE